MAVLRGIRVVEMGMWLAGPAAGGVLADWGADVIKIEPLTGDPMRQLFGTVGGSRETRCPPFDMFNRGKRSVALDVNHDDAAPIMEAILSSADVFLTNMRPAFLRRIGLDAETVMARFPALVYASLTGYGLEGPERDTQGYDVAAFFARSGVADRSRGAGAAPPTMAGGVGDVVSGMTMVAGILGALLSRVRTGEGQLVSTSLLRNGMYAIGMDVSTRVGLGRLAPLAGRTAPPNPLMNSYRSSDDKWFWMIGAESDRHWPRLLAALGQFETLTQGNFATSRDRRRNSAELVSILDDIFAQRTRDEWVELFNAHEVWWAPVNTVEDLLTDEQVLASGALVPAHHDGIADDSPRFTVATPIDFSEEAMEFAPHAPPVGADTDDVLLGCGLSGEAIAALRRSGVIGDVAGSPPAS